MSKFLKLAIALLVMAVAWPAAAGAAEVDAVDGPEDFTLLAGDGYSYGVPGGPGTGSPYTQLAGTPDNTYNWSGMHFDPDGAGGDPGMLLMGTLQNTFAFNQSFESRRAQIWRYDIPSAGDPRQGDWTLAWESPLLLGGIVPVPECVGMRGATYTNIGGVPRAVFSCTGGLGQLIGTTDGVNFTAASNRGLGLTSGYIGFRDIAAVDWDNNGTDDALMISPVGIAEDGGVIRTDLSPNDVMLINTNPFGFFSRWRVASDPGFGNDDNFVNFATKSIDTNGDGRNDAVAAIATNRVSGAEMYVATEGCAGGLFGGLFGGTCDMDWELVFDTGVGKPLQNVNCGRNGCDEQNPDIRNPNAYGSDFTQVGETVFVTLGETAFQGNDQAADETEIMAVYPPGSADCPVGADCGDWVVEILMGDPREGTAAALESDITNFHCTEMSTTAGNWCVPTSYMTASFGDVGDPGDGNFDWGDLDEGNPFYTWRAASDGTYAYFTTAGSSDSFFGFELWRLEPDGTLTNLFRNLGEGNLGGRTLFYADPLGIVIGTATLGDGADVFVGGCYDGPPIAEAGPAQVFFDRSGNGVVEYVTDDDDDDPDYDGYDEESRGNYVGELKLDGSASRGSPCDDLTSLAWYDGFGCAGGTGSVVASWSDPDDGDFGIYDPGSFATGGGIQVHEFSLEVTATEGGTVCSDHTVTASSNLPPAVDITAVTAVAPDTVVCNSSLTACSVVDFDESGTALLDVTAECIDDVVARCEWTSTYSVTDITPDPVLFEGARTYDQTPAGDTVRVAIDATSFDVVQCAGITEDEEDCLFQTEMDLEGEDENGFTDDSGLRMNLVPPAIDVQIEFDTGGSDACDEDIPGAVDESGVCILTQDTPIVGTPVEVWVQVENDGSIAADVTVTLDVDGNGTVTYLDDPAPFPYELPPFGVETFIKFSWTPASVGETTLTAEITSSGSPADNDPDDNIASRDFDVIDAVPAAVELEVTAISPQGTAVDGVEQDVDVTVANNGTDDATNPDFTVKLFDGTNTSGVCSGSELDTTTPATLTAGNDDTYTLSWTPTTDGSADLCAEVDIASDEVETNDALDTSVTVDPAPPAVELEVTAIAPQGSPVIGASQTVEVTVANNGTDDATNPNFTVKLTDGTNTSGVCSGSQLGSTTPTTLTAGNSATYDLTWVPGSAGSKNLCAEVIIASDAVQTNDALDTSVTVPVAVDLQVTTVTTADPAKVGVTQNVTATVRNNGTSTAAANGYTVTFKSGTASAGICSGTTITTVTTVGSIVSGATRDIIVPWTPSTPTGARTLCAQVAITSDAVSSNNAAQRSLTVNPVTTPTHIATFTGTKTGGNLLKVVTATVTVHNDSHVPVVGATVSFSYSRGALGTGTASCVTNASGTCSATGTVWFATTSTWSVTGVALPGTLYTPGSNHGGATSPKVF